MKSFQETVKRAFSGSLLAPLLTLFDPRWWPLENPKSRHKTKSMKKYYRNRTSCANLFQLTIFSAFHEKFFMLSWFDPPLLSTTSSPGSKNGVSNGNYSDVQSGSIKMSLGQSKTTGNLRSPQLTKDSGIRPIYRFSYTKKTCLQNMSRTDNS